MAAGAPWRIDWKMKGGLGSGARWHRTPRLILWTGACWVIYVHVPFAGPQEQISTVYFSELKAAGRQQLLYFWTLDKLNSARCKHTWQGGRLSIFFIPLLHLSSPLAFPSHPPPPPSRRRERNSEHYWFIIPPPPVVSLHNGDISITWRSFRLQLLLHCGSHHARLPVTDQ